MKIEVLLDEQSSEKLSLFKVINKIEEATVSPNSLLKDLDFSYYKMKKILEEVNQEMLTLFQQPLLNEKGSIENFLTSHHLITYRKFLIKKSVACQFLFFLLQQKKPCLEDFLDQHYLSRASLFRKLKKTKSYLESLGLQLNISKMSLKGSESLIRLTYFQLFSLVDFQSNFKPDSQITQIVTNLQEEGFSSLHEESLLLFLNITKSRLTCQNFLTTETFTLPPTKKNSLLITFLKNLLPKENLICETNFFFGFLYFWPNYFHLEDPRRPQLEILLPQQTTTELVQVLLQDFEKYCPLSFSEEKILTYNLTNLLQILQLNPTTPPFFSDMFSVEIAQLQAGYTLLFPQIKKKLKSLLKRKDFQIFQAYEKDLWQIFTAFLLPFYTFSPKKTLQVGVEATFDFLAVTLICQALKELPFVRYQLFFKNSTSCHYDALIFLSEDPKMLSENFSTAHYYLDGKNFQLDQLRQSLTKCHEKKVEAIPSLVANS